MSTEPRTTPYRTLREALADLDPTHAREAPQPGAWFVHHGELYRETPTGVVVEPA